MTGGETNPSPTCIRVQVRRALTLQIGKKDQAITTSRYTFGLACKDFIRVYARPVFQRTFGQANIITYPAQREASSLRHTHKIPGMRDRMVKRMDARNRAGSVNLRRFRMS